MVLNFGPRAVSRAAVDGVLSSLIDGSAILIVGVVPGDIIEWREGVYVATQDNDGQGARYAVPYSRAIREVVFAGLLHGPADGEGAAEFAYRLMGAARSSPVATQTAFYVREVGGGSPQ